MRVELPDGWAELRDPETLTRGDQKAVLKASKLEIDPEAGVARVDGSNDEDMQDAMLARVITSWSFPLPLPSKVPGSLNKLSIAQGKALGEAVKPHLELITTKVDPGKRDTDPTAG